MDRTRKAQVELEDQPVWMTGAGGLVNVVPEDIQLLLISAAKGAVTAECRDEDCEGCEAFRRAFWALDTCLTSSQRRAYQKVLRVAGIALPAGPWEPAS